MQHRPRQLLSISMTTLNNLHIILFLMASHIDREDDLWPKSMHCSSDLLYEFYAQFKGQGFDQGILCTATSGCVGAAESMVRTGTMERDQTQ